MRSAHLKYVLAFVFVLALSQQASAGSMDNASTSAQQLIDAGKSHVNNAVNANVAEFRGVFMDFLMSGWGAGGLPLLESGHPVIQTIAPPLFQMLIPFYELAILIVGTFYVWGAMSPSARNSAKSQLMRLVIGMVACSLALEFLDFFIQMQIWVCHTLLSAVPGASNFGLVDMFMKGIAVILPVGLAAVIIAVLVPTGVSQFCGGTTLIVGILTPLLMPYIILALRYVMVLVLGAFAPLTIFLLSFNFTKGLGEKMLRMTLTWIFVPVICAFLVLIMVQTSVWSSTPLISAAINLGCLFLMGGAPMMVLGLMTATGAVVSHVGRTKGDTRILFLGEVMHGKGASSFMSVAEHSAYERSSHLSPKGLESEMGSNAAKGVDSSGAVYPGRTRGAFMDRKDIEAQMRQSGRLGAGQKLSYWGMVGERAKRLVMGQQVEGVGKGDRYQWMSVGERSRAYIEDLWSQRKYGRATVAAAGLGLVSVVHGMAVEVPVRSAGHTLANASKQFTLKGDQTNAVTRLANRMRGYWEVDPVTGQKHFNQGFTSLKNVGRSVYDASGGADGKRDKGKVFKTAMKAGVYGAAGVAVASVFFPALGSAAVVTLGGAGLSAGVAAGAGLAGAGMWAMRGIGKGIYTDSSDERKSERRQAYSEMKARQLRARGLGAIQTESDFNWMKSRAAQKATVSRERVDELDKKIQEAHKGGASKKEIDGLTSEYMQAQKAAGDAAELNKSLENMSYGDFRQLRARQQGVAAVEGLQRGELNHDAMQAIDDRVQAISGEIEDTQSRMGGFREMTAAEMKAVAAGQRFDEMVMEAGQDPGKVKSMMETRNKLAGEVEELSVKRDLAGGSSDEGRRIQGEIDERQAKVKSIDGELEKNGLDAKKLSAPLNEHAKSRQDRLDIQKSLREANGGKEYTAEDYKKDEARVGQLGKKRDSIDAAVQDYDNLSRIRDIPVGEGANDQDRQNLYRLSQVFEDMDSNIGQMQAKEAMISSDKDKPGTASDMREIAAARGQMEAYQDAYNGRSLNEQGPRKITQVGEDGRTVRRGEKGIVERSLNGTGDVATYNDLHSKSREFLRKRDSESAGRLDDIEGKMAKGQRLEKEDREALYGKDADQGRLDKLRGKKAEGKVLTADEQRELFEKGGLREWERQTLEQNGSELKRRDVDAVKYSNMQDRVDAYHNGYTGMKHEAAPGTPHHELGQADRDAQLYKDLKVLNQGYDTQKGSLLSLGDEKVAGFTRERAKRLDGALDTLGEAYSEQTGIDVKAPQTPEERDARQSQNVSDDRAVSAINSTVAGMSNDDLSHLSTAGSLAASAGSASGGAGSSGTVGSKDSAGDDKSGEDAEKKGGADESGKGSADSSGDSGEGDSKDAGGGSGGRGSEGSEDKGKSGKSGGGSPPTAGGGEGKDVPREGMVDEVEVPDDTPYYEDDGGDQD